MTSLGKFLALVNLAVGIAILSWSVSIYVQRPAWFDTAPPAEGIDKGNNPLTFAQLKADIDALTRAASAASADWGTNLRVLEKLEATRAKRLKGYEERVKWARDGNPKDGGNAFYEPVYQEDGLLDLVTLGPPIKGSPGDLPLKGADTLLKTVSADVAKTVEMSQAIEKRRKEFAALGVQILQAEGRLLKMNEIRDAVQNEAFYLATFEVNVYETRETVLRRKRQLATRLTELGGKP